MRVLAGADNLTGSTPSFDDRTLGRSKPITPVPFGTNRTASQVTHKLNPPLVYCMPMRKRSHRVIGYIRVSTEEQSQSGLGLADQRAVIESEAKRRAWDDLLV